MTLFHSSVSLPCILARIWYIFALLNQGKEMYEHNALGYRSGLALCLSKVRSSRARCPATALIFFTKSSYLDNNLS